MFVVHLYRVVLRSYLYYDYLLIPVRWHFRRRSITGCFTIVSPSIAQVFIYKYIRIYVCAQYSMLLLCRRGSEFPVMLCHGG